MTKYKMETDSLGSRFWKNEKGQYHREEGPAIKWYDGKKEWYLNGKKLTEEEFYDWWLKRGKRIALCRWTGEGKNYDVIQVIEDVPHHINSVFVRKQKEIFVRDENVVTEDGAEVFYLHNSMIV